VSRRGAICGIAVLLAALAADAHAPADAAACADADLRPDGSNLARVEAAMVCLLNRERGRHDLEPLKLSPRLERSAAAHTADMTTHGYFAHHQKGRPFLYERLRDVHYFKRTYTALYSENLGYGPPEYASAGSMHDAFMGSSGHRLNMLYGRFRNVGIGSMLIGPHPAFYPDYEAVVFTIDFGRRYVRRKRCRRARAGASGGDGAEEPRRRSTRPRRHCKRRRR